MLTVYGIETDLRSLTFLVAFLVATVLTVYGIETSMNIPTTDTRDNSMVATVLTVYGIETGYDTPFHHTNLQLQQCLPFTVLKPEKVSPAEFKIPNSCNSAYRLRY